MSKQITSIGYVFPPTKAPEAGYWESITFLDQNGYFHDTGSYETAMMRAGLRAVAPGKSGGEMYYSVTTHSYGLFADGVGALGRDFLEILANEGFEGEVADPNGGIVYVLLARTVREHAAACGSDVTEMAPDRRLVA